MQSKNGSVLITPPIIQYRIAEAKLSRQSDDRGKGIREVGIVWPRVLGRFRNYLKLLRWGFVESIQHAVLGIWRPCGYALKLG